MKKKINQIFNLNKTKNLSSINMKEKLAKQLIQKLYVLRFRIFDYPICFIFPLMIEWVCQG